jgi:hypothetical protein
MKERMSEAHGTHKEMKNPYKNTSVKTWREVNVSGHALRHILDVLLNKELNHGEPVGEFPFISLSHIEQIPFPLYMQGVNRV